MLLYDLQSPLAVVAIVATLRRYVPQIDGPLVLVAAVVVGVLLALPGATERGVPLYFAALDGALSGLAALGAMTAIDRAAPKAAPQEESHDPRR